MKNPLKPTLTNLINNAGHIPPALIRAVVKQIGGWQEFTDRAEDITNHGINGGFSGFIYYHSDTVPFARKHKANILTMAEQQAEDIGEDVYSMIASFNCINDLFEEHRPNKARAAYTMDQYESRPNKHAGKIAAIIHGRAQDSNEFTQVFNALAWYAAEEVARAYCDLLEG